MVPGWAGVDRIIRPYPRCIQSNLDLQCLDVFCLPRLGGAQRLALQVASWWITSRSCDRPACWSDPAGEFALGQGPP